MIPNLFAQVKGYNFPFANPASSWVFQEPSYAIELRGQAVVRFDGKNWWWLTEAVSTTPPFKPAYDGYPFKIGWYPIKQLRGWAKVKLYLRHGLPKYNWYPQIFPLLEMFEDSLKDLPYAPGDYMLTEGRLLSVNGLPQLGQIQVINFQKLTEQDGFDRLKAELEHLPIRGVLFKSIDGNKLAKVETSEFDYSEGYDADYSSNNGDS